MRRDPVIAALIRRHGDCGLASAAHADPFHALLQAIIAQQLSAKAVKTIEGRFSAIFGGNPTPAAVARVSDEQLRAEIREKRYLAAEKLLSNPAVDPDSTDEDGWSALMYAVRTDDPNLVKLLLKAGIGAMAPSPEVVFTT